MPIATQICNEWLHTQPGWTGLYAIIVYGSNTIFGATDFQDPGTEEVYNVGSGSNYCWNDNHGTVLGTQTVDSPSPSIDFAPLREVSTSSEAQSRFSLERDHRHEELRAESLQQ